MRSAFPGWVPKTLKGKSGHADAPLVPAHIRVLHTHLRKEERDKIRKKLGRKLGKYRRTIERVSLRVTDVNGPRGGIDQICRIKVVLRHLPSVVVETQNADLRTAFDRALTATERAVRRRLRRKRMKPVKFAAQGRAHRR